MGRTCGAPDRNVPNNNIGLQKSKVAEMIGKMAQIGQAMTIAAMMVKAMAVQPVL